MATRAAAPPPSRVGSATPLAPSPWQLTGSAPPLRPPAANGLPSLLTQRSQSARGASCPPPMGSVPALPAGRGVRRLMEAGRHLVAPPLPPAFCSPFFYFFSGPVLGRNRAGLGPACGGGRKRKRSPSGPRAWGRQRVRPLRQSPGGQITSPPPRPQPRFRPGPPGASWPQQRHRRDEPQEVAGRCQVLPLLLQPARLRAGQPPPRLQPLDAAGPPQLRRRAGLAAAGAAPGRLRLLRAGGRLRPAGGPGGPGRPQGAAGAAGAVFRAPAAAPHGPDHDRGHRLHAARGPGRPGGRPRAGPAQHLPGLGGAGGRPRELGRAAAAARLLRLERPPGLGHPRRPPRHRRLLLPGPPRAQRHPRDPPGAPPRPLPHGRPRGGFHQGLCRGRRALAGREPRGHRGGRPGPGAAGAVPAAARHVPAAGPGPGLGVLTGPAPPMGSEGGNGWRPAPPIKTEGGNGWRPAPPIKSEGGNGWRPAPPIKGEGGNSWRPAPPIKSEGGNGWRLAPPLFPSPSRIGV